MMFKLKLNRKKDNTVHSHDYAISVDKQSLFMQKVRKDERIKSLFAKKKDGVYAIDTASLIEELQDLHQARRYRVVKTDEFLQSAQRKLIDWNLENNAQRGRCVAIKMRSFKIKRLLEEHLKTTKNYLLTEYSGELKNQFNTKAGKEGAVDYVLESFYMLLHKLDTVLGMADILLNDLIEAKWSVRNSIETLKIQHGND